jgi:GT2 family glycosyltransferase
MDFSIIIVSYNTRELLKKCLSSIDGSYKTEIIVVDNGSTDGSVETIKKLATRYSFGNVKFKIILNKENMGFAKAVNQGIRKASGDYILLLNSDIIVKPKAIEKMLEFVKRHPEAGVIGGRLLNPDGSIQGSCFYLPRLTRPFAGKYNPGDKPTEVEAVVGAVFLIPHQVLEKVGFFDERYFMYFEDLDYCRRVKQAGFKIYYLPSAEFIHEHGASGASLPQKAHQWLVESSKIYHGKLKYYLMTLIIWLGQRWQRFFKR